MGSKYTEAQKAASMRYMKDNTDNIQIRMPKGTKDRWKAAANHVGKTLSKFITDLVEQEIQTQDK